MHEQSKCHDACPNAVQFKFKLSSIWQKKNGLSIEFLTKTPKIWKTTWKFCNKLTNWSSHKTDYSKEWSITSSQQANFIKLNQIEQNPQFGFNTSPRILKTSQNPKLIKLTNIDHEYNSISTKPIDQLHKIRRETSKSPIYA